MVLVKNVMIPNKWHNSNNGFLAVGHLSNSYNNSDILAIDISRTKYINFSVFILFELIINRMKIDFNKDTIFYYQDNENINTTGYYFSDFKELKHLCVRHEEVIEAMLVTNYSKNDDEKFINDVKLSLKCLNNKELEENLLIHISELFINVDTHVLPENNQFGEYAISFGLLKSDKRLTLVLANNGMFFLRE